MKLYLGIYKNKPELFLVSRNPCQQTFRIVSLYLSDWNLVGAMLPEENGVSMQGCQLRNLQLSTIHGL